MSLKTDLVLSINTVKHDALYSKLRSRKICQPHYPIKINEETNVSKN